VSSFNGCRCVQDTRTVDEKSGLKGAVLFLEGRWRDGPVKKTTKIPRKYPRRLGVSWIKVSFQPPSDAFYAANGLRPPEAMSLVQHHQPAASTPDNYDSAGLGGWGHTILPAGGYLPMFGKLVVQLPSDFSVVDEKAPIEVQSFTPSAGEEKEELNKTPYLMQDPRESFLYCAPPGRAMTEEEALAESVALAQPTRKEVVENRALEEGAAAQGKVAWKVVGDGHCFFRALAVLLGMPEDDHHRVRARVVQAVLSTPVLQQLFEFAGDNWEVWCRKMSAGEWGDSYARQAAAYAFSRRLKVLELRYKQCGAVWTTVVESPPAHGIEDGPALWLHYKQAAANREHYDALIDVDVAIMPQSQPELGARSGTPTRKRSPPQFIRTPGLTPDNQRRRTTSPSPGPGAAGVVGGLMSKVAAWERRGVRNNEAGKDL